MKISDTATVHAPATEVWAALTDPAVLAAAIPGCELLEPTGPGSWRFTLTARVASIDGTLAGDATITHRQERTSVTLSASGAGGPGTVTATIRITLTPGADGTTDLSYDADAAIGGQLAGVGQRMLASAATRMAGQFASALGQILTRNGAVSASRPPGARPAGLQPATLAARSFLPGVLAGGAAGAVAGFVAARLIARRSR
jgi:carbon monoxide dehydrogenase subunit G